MLLLAACGTNQSSDGAAGSSCDTSKGPLVIGMIVPLSGGVSAVGLGMRNSADLAIRQANEHCAVPGYRLVFQPEDDQEVPQVAAQAATTLASNPQVAAVLGTLNSSTAQTVAPILAREGIAQVSPANTNPALTVGPDAAAPKRQFPTYFRLATTDLLQGPFAARYLVQEAGKKRIAVIDDGKAYGAGLTQTFVAEAQQLGADVVARERVGEHDTEFSSVITRIRSANPDAVFYGGEFPVAGPLSKQLADAGLSIPVMGGDAINDKQFIALGGRQSDLATSIGAPAQSLPSAKSFLDQYAAAYTEPATVYGPLSYDSANVVIDALAKVVSRGDFTSSRRQELIHAIQQTNLEGAAGHVSFDQFGDTTNKVLTVYTVRGGDFVPVETGTFDGGAPVH
ncbi:branched-chain amino acid ABC transporter substrate-binding protein [Pseudonocardia alaniniphila]|uniref:Branched-chain amino acid ABC transporter substrate-binding protein n=1 Tax=Pseudonocardia alaniniphila TaxID=75291 RepID=A0ABS9T9L5_9PSEU|nr:branched-chain amino acid ABC transporter substrate-binding protein [Pseudonocardia alaniniphila]MCH6165113.1 branched-chain amino acid ABC transporter substrate-binding protein [Pseudonocardia alaniniphila]